MEITFSFVNKPGALGRRFFYKTLAGARRKAHKLVGTKPRLDPDGYAVARNGDCLFFSGASFSDLWPDAAKT